MLIGGDRAVGVREGGVEMGEDLGHGPMRGRQVGRLASLKQCGANLALAQVEALPDALHGSVTQMTLDGANRGRNAVGDGALEELPQRAGGHLQSSNFVDMPNAERATAAGPSVAVAAKDPASAHGLPRGITVVVPAQIAVPIERANRFAMRARHLLEPLGNRVPFVVVAKKPPLFAHVCPTPHENGNCTCAG